MFSSETSLFSTERLKYTLEMKPGNTLQLAVPYVTITVVVVAPSDVIFVVLYVPIWLAASVDIDIWGDICFHGMEKSKNQVVIEPTLLGF